MSATASQHLDDYSFRHLSDHLAASQRAGTLYRLVTHPPWFVRSTAVDASELLYKRDIDRACLAYGHRLDQQPNLTDPNLIKDLVRPATLAWLSANSGRLANKASIAALEALALSGELSQALDRAQRIPIPIRRARAMIRLADVAFRTHDHANARWAWDQARELLLASPADFFNEDLEALALLAQSLADAGRGPEARDLAKIIDRRIDNEIDGSDGVGSGAHVARTVAWACLGDRDAVIDVVAKLKNDWTRFTALVGAAQKSLSNHPDLTRDLLDRALALHSEKQSSQEVFRLAIVLAESGRMAECEKLVGDRLSVEQQMRLTVAHAKSALLNNNPDIGRSLIKQAITSAAALGPKASLKLLNNLNLCRPALDLSGDGPGIVTLITKMLQNDRANLNGSDLGLVALGLARFGDRRQARPIIAEALDWHPALDDRQEISALCRLARILGAMADLPGLNWILAKLKKCRSSWLQADLAHALTSAYREAGNEIKASRVEAILQATATETDDEPRLYSRGVLALWHASKNQPDSERVARDMIEALVDEIKRGDSAPDDLAELALTLSQGKRGHLADEVFDRTIDAIRAEPDPNTVSRVIGTASEAAIRADRPAILNRLIPLARGIEDDYLQAQALFWLAGWKARAKAWRESHQLFREAAQKGLDASVPMERIERIASKGGMDEVEDIALAIGYPHTLAAAIFGGLLMALETPDAESVLRSLPVLDHMPEGYDHFRCLCHQNHFAVLDRLPNRKKNLIRYWVTALETNRQRDSWDVWAVIAAGLPILASRFGSRLAQVLYAELNRIDPAATSNPLRDFKESDLPVLTPHHDAITSFE